VHQVGNQPRLYYDARSTNHQDIIDSVSMSFYPSAIKQYY